MRKLQGPSLTPEEFRRPQENNVKPPSKRETSSGNLKLAIDSCVCAGSVTPPQKLKLAEIQYRSNIERERLCCAAAASLSHSSGASSCWHGNPTLSFCLPECVDSTIREFCHTLATNLGLFGQDRSKSLVTIATQYMYIRVRIWHELLTVQRSGCFFAQNTTPTHPLHPYCVNTSISGGTNEGEQMWASGTNAFFVRKRKKLKFGCNLNYIGFHSRTLKDSVVLLCCFGTVGERNVRKSGGSTLIRETITGETTLHVFSSHTTTTRQSVTEGGHYHPAFYNNNRIAKVDDRQTY